MKYLSMVKFAHTVFAICAIFRETKVSQAINVILDDDFTLLGEREEILAPSNRLDRFAMVFRVHNVNGTDIWLKGIRLNIGSP